MSRSGGSFNEKYGSGRKASGREAKAQEAEAQEAESQEAEAQEAEVTSWSVWRKTQKDTNKEAAQKPRPHHKDARGWYR